MKTQGEKFSWSAGSDHRQLLLPEVTTLGHLVPLRVSCAKMVLLGKIIRCRITFPAFTVPKTAKKTGHAFLRS